MAYDPQAASHSEWIGYVQPVGVVVSTSALLEAGAVINRHFIPLHQRFLATLPHDPAGVPIPRIEDFRQFAIQVLEWDDTDLSSPDASLTVAVPGYEDILEPSYVVNDGANPLMLIRQTDTPVEALDKDTQESPRHWSASPQMRFERLLRETGVPIGLLVSPEAIRLVYAPKGESSGNITFQTSQMEQIAGRPILAALYMLLSKDRLFTLTKSERLPDLLTASRRHQSLVSNKLAEQVMEALFHLLRGFQAAQDQTGFLSGLLQEDPNQVYSGLLTVLLRLVFILFAEHRDLLSANEIFVKGYSIGGLFEKLREDYAQHPDTMDQRYGAWAHLISLFRVIYGGARHGTLDIPGRKGYLFDPNRYPFLEGRETGNVAETDRIDTLPRVPDGVVYDVLRNLMVLDGERLSYRNLDVEQIGSVYEAMMGFELHVAAGPSVALKPKKRHGAPITVNLEEILAIAPAKRNEWLGKTADQKLTGKAETKLKDAKVVAEVLDALDNRVAKNVTPDPVPSGAMIFQPSPERRRSGSHYTPRSLTAPIVQASLAPVLEQLGLNPRPQQILALKICDPAMGSGAFLVEACRQLGDALVKAWHSHKELPFIAADEDELLHARRVVAQRCLYGVDKNPVAVDLGKLSLWLATLARDHEFTFLDHSLRHGDSLVGFSARQIAAFDWEPRAQIPYMEEVLRGDLARAATYRKRILDAQDGTPYLQLAQQLGAVEDQLRIARNLGDVLVAAFFRASKKKAREAQRVLLLDDVKLAFGVPAPGSAAKPDAVAGVRLSEIGLALRKQDKPIVPFHWELEFPEVFALDDSLHCLGGFDTIVGNPPFAGKNTILDGSPASYISWLKQLHPESHGSADLVAHFFRRAFNLLRTGGCFGLIATNTIGQGDTRSSGLRYIVMNGGTIYRAVKRYKWPGEAAVVVSIIHVAKGKKVGPYLLNGRTVDVITAFLFHAGGNEDPNRLVDNAEKSFQGSIVLGMGFTFDDTDKKGVASPISDMEHLIEKNQKNATRIFPYLGGEEVNNSPKQVNHRFVINFEDFPLKRKPSGHGWLDLTEETQRQQLREGVVAHDYPHPVAEDWPDLLEVIERRVKPERDKLEGNKDAERRRKFFWQWGRYTPALFRALESRPLAYCISRVSEHLGCVRIPSSIVASDRLVVFPVAEDSSFTVIQSRVHGVWARFFSATLEDRLMYAPSDCFETFPFPIGYETMSVLEEIGRSYYDFRAALMISNNEGLTKTYNRFNRPDEYSPDIMELRRLHDAMDHAVLEAYGWTDLQPIPEFFPEFEADEDTEDDAPVRARKGGKRLKYRYRWPDDIHDEVLARLLALNRERAALAPQDDADQDVDDEDEALEDTEGAPAPKPKRSAKVRSSAKKNSKPTDSSTLSLF